MKKEKNSTVSGSGDNANANANANAKALKKLVSPLSSLNISIRNKHAEAFRLRTKFILSAG